MNIAIRPAQAADAHVAVGLIHSSGARALDYGFSAGSVTCLQFLNRAFRDGRGFFGWANHTVAVVEDSVVGIGAFYGSEEYVRLSLGLAAQVARFYPWARAAGVLGRCLRLQRLMRPPSPGMHYVANLGVDERWRSRGIGRALLAHERERARTLGRDVLALDVAVDNPRARRLYESLGFVATGESRMAGGRGEVPDTTRMEARCGERARQ